MTDAQENFPNIKKPSVSTDSMTITSDQVLDNMTREELVRELKTLRKHVKNMTTLPSSGSSLQDKALQKPFDFSKHNVRHVALKVAYFGWNYQGLLLLPNAY